MSTESFKAFATRIQQDSSLQDEIRAASGENGITIEALAALAAQRGYDFTAEDVSNELNDAQLEGVAGGLGRQTIPTGVFPDLKFSTSTLGDTLYIKWIG